MTFQSLFTLVFSLFFCLSLNAQLTLKVETFPANTPAIASLHVAGDFQGWDPSDPDYILTKDENTQSYVCSD